MMKWVLLYCSTLLLCLCVCAYVADSAGAEGFPFFLFFFSFFLFSNQVTGSFSLESRVLSHLSQSFLAQEDGQSFSLFLY